MENNASVWQGQGGRMRGKREKAAELVGWHQMIELLFEPTLSF